MEEFVNPISKEDAVSQAEKRAFVEMQRQIETTKDAISEDPHLQKEIQEMIESLPKEQERDVIRQIFFEGKNYAEVGRTLKLSGERIRGIEAVALRKLRHPKMEKYTEGVELTNDSYRDRLSQILPLNYSKVTENKEIEKILRKIDYFTWGGEIRLRLNKLDSLIFNEICDEIKAIVSKEKYTEKDVVALKAIAKRLDQDVKKITL